MPCYMINNDTVFDCLFTSHLFYVLHPHQNLWSGTYPYILSHHFLTIFNCHCHAQNLCVSHAVVCCVYSTVFTYINQRRSSIKNKYHTFLMLLTSVSSSFVPKLVQTFLHIAKITVSICATIVFCLFRSGAICKYVFFQKLYKPMTLEKQIPGSYKHFRL
jgi:hypothetical protein